MNATLEPHPEDGALLRLIDDALEDDERGAVLAHIRRCPHCRSRDATLRAISTRWSAALERTDPVRLRGVEPRFDARAGVRTRRGSSWLQAAIVLLALGLLALATPPVRAWLAERWDALTSTQAAIETPARPETQMTSATSTSVAFATEDSVFTLEFAASQTVGMLRLVSDPASTRVLAEASIEGPEFVVRRGGLRIENAGTTADYRIVLPAAVRVVRLGIGGGPERILRPDPAEPERTLTLGGS